MIMKTTFFDKVIHKLHEKINKRNHSFLNIPGMIGYDERMNLFNTCQNEISGKGAIIEFGSFFGASSSAIQQGVKNNKLITNNIKFHIVDCFQCSLASEFSQLTRDLARQHHVEHLLSEEDGWLKFHKVFQSNLDMNDPILIVHQCFVSNFIWKSQPVELLHLDLPKDWSQASHIASIIFPDLVVGGKILFQDFGYQWSAELIGMVGILIKMKLISPYKLTDTTLSVRVEHHISSESIEAIKIIMKSPSEVLAGIDIAENACKEITTPLVKATISMAKAQYKYSQNDVAGCFQIIASLLKNYSINPAVSLKLSDLFSRSFLIDKSYEKQSDLKLKKQES